MDSPAILDKDGNLHLPNGSSASGTSTPSVAKAQNAVPLPSRGDATGKGASVGTGTFGVKVGLAQMLKGGVIMDVMNAEQAKIAEEAGAVAVMALEVSSVTEKKSTSIDFISLCSESPLISELTVVSLEWYVAHRGRNAMIADLPYFAVRPANDQGDHRCRLHPRHGQGPDRPHCRSIIEHRTWRVYPSLPQVEAQILQAVGVDYIDGM